MVESIEQQTENTQQSWREADRIISAWNWLMLIPKTLRTSSKSKKNSHIIVLKDRDSNGSSEFNIDESGESRTTTISSTISSVDSEPSSTRDSAHLRSWLVAYSSGTAPFTASRTKLSIWWNDSCESDFRRGPTRDKCKNGKAWWSQASDTEGLTRKVAWRTSLSSFKSNSTRNGGRDCCAMCNRQFRRPKWSANRLSSGVSATLKPSKMSAGRDEVSFSLETMWYSNEEALVYSTRRSYCLFVPTQSHVAERGYLKHARVLPKIPPCSESLQIEFDS